jgi:hypothetical protein
MEFATYCPNTSDPVMIHSHEKVLHTTVSEISLSTCGHDIPQTQWNCNDEDKMLKRIADWKKHSTREQRRKHSNTISTSSTRPWLESAVLDDIAPISERRLPNRLRRESYRSVREDLDAPQSFVVTNSSRNVATEDEDAPYEETYDGAERIARAWRGSKLRHKLQSHSLTDLKRWFSADKVWTLNSIARKDDEIVEKSPLEQLPAEVVDNIFSFLGPYDPDGFATLSKDLLSCMLTSRTMYALTVSSLFGNVQVPHPMMFGKFMFRLREDPTIGSLVRRLDFSRYSNIGWGRTRQASLDAQNLNSTILLQCLDVLPNLQEFLVHEHLDDEMTEQVLTSLFQMPAMQALDFCACSSGKFVESFTAVATQTFSASQTPAIWLSQITRLSLHECTTLQSPVFEAVLPQLPRLTHLDVAHTLINDNALAAIPHTARITHLNLSRCTQITGSRTVEFLTNHPAVRDSLVVLNIMSDSKRYKLLDTDDCATLLPRLPFTLRSLNIGGSGLNDSHLPALLPFTRVLEELSVRDAHLSADGLESIFRLPETLKADEEWTGSTLRYIDVSGVPELNHRSVNYSLDLLTTEQSLPLEVIELSDPVVKQLKGLKRPPGHPDWMVKEFGRRGWYVRQTGVTDNGARGWKKGSRWWGARKIPMADMEVGGMYGYYMFKN